MGDRDITPAELQTLAADALCRFDGLPLLSTEPFLKSTPVTASFPLTPLAAQARLLLEAGGLQVVGRVLNRTRLPFVVELRREGQSIAFASGDTPSEALLALLDVEEEPHHG